MNSTEQFSNVILLAEAVFWGEQKKYQGDDSPTTSIRFKEEDAKKRMLFSAPHERGPRAAQFGHSFKA